MKYDKEYIKKLNELKKRRFAMQSLITLKLAYPYLLDTGIVVGILSLIGATPFYRESTNVSLQTAKTINSLGNDKTVNLFTGENLKKDGQVIYYSKWNQNDEGYFERDIKKYDINNMNDYVLEKLIAEPETVDKLESIFGSAIVDAKEVKEHVEQEELNTPAYIETTIYSKDNNQVMKIKESVNTNEVETLMAILLTLITCGMIKVYRETRGYNKDLVKKDRNKINEQYLSKVYKLNRKYEKKSDNE